MFRVDPWTFDSPGKGYGFWEGPMATVRHRIPTPITCGSLRQLVLNKTPAKHRNIFRPLRLRLRLRQLSHSYFGRGE